MVSKLLEVFIVRELASRISSSSNPFVVVVNNVSPGFCESTLRRDYSGIQAAATSLMECVMQRKTSVGARTLVHAVAAGRESHGQYLNDCHVHPSPLDTGKLGDEGELRRRIWGELVTKLEKIEPGVSKDV